MTILALTTSLAFAGDTPDPIVTAELGQGVVVHGNDDVTFQIRARAQERFTFIPGDDGSDAQTYFQVRRLRLVFLAKMPSRDLQLYIQLGLSPQDMESDLLVPLRDAVVTWQPLRDLGFKLGQQKVPFNRERLISSSALELVDRSIVNAELSLDRDIGLQAFSNDLFGFGDRLGYALGVFNGDGRNVVIGDTGLLYVARLELRPLGKFEDSYQEADISRDPRARLAMGLAVGHNASSTRSRSTHGVRYEVADFSYDQAEADVIFKAAGFSLLGEATVRAADEGEFTAEVDGVEITELSRSGWGWFAQAGFVFPNGMEPAARFSQVYPLPGIETDIQSDQEIRLGYNWYFQGHDLKWQTDFGILGGDAHPDTEYEVRSQVQVYF